MSVQVIDGHCHADLLLERDARFPGEYRKRGCGGISWSYPEGIRSWRDYPSYWGRLRDMAVRLGDHGCPFFYLVGIHPRCIPDDLTTEEGLPPDLVQAVEEHLQEPLCLGFGEIGLDTASDLEGWILRRQLDLAMRSLPETKGVGIHTPRADKDRVTRDILVLLGEYGGLKERMLIDHVTPETYPAVRAEGYHTVGMTLQPGKTSVEDLVEFIREHPDRAESIVLGSDGAREISDWFFHFLDHRETLGEEERRRLLLENAQEFWGIEG